MARVIDLRSNGGDLVLIGKTLVLPASNEEVIAGAEPMLGAGRYNTETGYIEFYMPVKNELAWNRIVLEDEIKDFLKKTGDTMVGDLYFAPNVKLILDDGTETTPSLTFLSSQNTGLSSVSRELLFIAEGFRRVTVGREMVTVFGDFTVTDIATIDQIEARVANVALANVAVANAALLTANVANVSALDANAALIADLAANTANLAALIANTASIAFLDAQDANVANLFANALLVESIDAPAANIGNLFANAASLETLDAQIANVANLFANAANLVLLDAATGNVSNLYANAANLAALDAQVANVANLFANTANLVLLAAESANVANLAANTANLIAFTANLGTIETLVANVANVGPLTATSVAVVPEEEAEDLLSQLDLATQGALWQITHEADHSLTVTYQANTAFTFFANGTLAGEHFTGSASSVTGADLAERYRADAVYEPGTVMVIGGAAEITIATRFADPKLAGVISTLPGLRMNESAGSDDTHPFIALKGRVPCKVVGPVAKGDLLVSSPIAGHAQASARQDQPESAVVGRALQDLPGSGTGTIEIKV